MFDAFQFIQDRIEGKPLTDTEISEFRAFNVLQALSMDPRYRGLVNALNDTKFTKLPQEVQAKTFKFLHGHTVDNRWSRAKVQYIAARDQFVNKVMIVYGISHNSAVADIRAGLIDEKYVEEAYNLMTGEAPKLAKAKK